MLASAHATVVLASSVERRRVECGPHLAFRVSDGAEDRGSREPKRAAAPQNSERKTRQDSQGGVYVARLRFDLASPVARRRPPSQATIPSTLRSHCAGDTATTPRKVAALEPFVAACRRCARCPSRSRASASTFPSVRTSRSPPRTHSSDPPKASNLHVCSVTAACRAPHFARHRPSSA